MANHNNRTVKMRYLTLAAAVLAAAGLYAGAQQPTTNPNPNAYGQGQYGQYGQSGNTGGYGGYGGSGYGGGGYGNQGGYGGGYGGGGYGNSGGMGGIGSGFGSSFGSNSSGTGGFGSSRFGSRRSRGSQDQNLTEGSTGVPDSGSRSSRRTESQRNGRGSSRRSRGNDALQKGGKNQKGGATQPGAVPQGARVQGKTNVVARKAPAGAAAGGGPAERWLPEVKVDASIENIKDTLYFTPGMVVAAPGDRFITTLAFFGLKPSPVDEVDLWIHYNPSIIAPLWADPAKMKPYVDGDVESRVWADRGYLRLHARFTSAPKGMSYELADIHWRALTPSLEAPITLEAPEGQAVAVRAGKINLVEGDTITNAHKSGVSVSIVPQSWEDEPGLRTVAQVDAMTPPAPLDGKGRLRLALLAAQKQVATGQVGTLDVALVNPSGLALDELKLRIRFDPEAVAILDADQENYIADGINIFDGDFHEKYPFDAHLRNQVDPERGIIEYQVGSVMSPRIYPTGVFARIVYRMKREAGKAAFWIEAEDPTLKVRATDVTARGLSLLGGTPAVVQEALHGVEVAVKPLILDSTPPVESKSAALH